MENELVIEHLKVRVGNKEILHDINMVIPQGETHLLLGANGCGKTTLLMTIMGMPQYKIVSGEIKYKGRVINDMAIDERAELGIGLSYQKPPEIKGVTLKKLLHTVSEASAIDYEALGQLNMENYLDRDINLSFSGGEIKRAEILTLLHQNPDFIMMDEPESGVDIENLKIIGGVAQRLLDKTDEIKIKERKKSGLIITHTGYILEYIEADKAYIMIDGRMTCSGNPHELFREVQKHGYRKCAECAELI